ncbi:hypothetical protein SCOCK_100188 [Actinacidiphila cocklensis]|uniref:Uncharacterized protein n=1 Tax=Actinacidiphila cocklensis TaxID=887465 RepID=A0A9W4GNC7_9ACTN|nr:hypothetical protein SCOCK_100188 [Actinacidiphila cocklensis]
MYVHLVADKEVGLTPGRTDRELHRILVRANRVIRTGRPPYAESHRVRPKAHYLTRGLDVAYLLTGLQG